MNFIKTFESRVSDAFGASPRGHAAPFSFKRLAKLAAKELEAETYVIDGVDTAPALYTILVSAADDTAMRPLYPQLTLEVVSFAKAEAKHKGYTFVGEPLARFMVDPKLRPGKFDLFAENVDAVTLERLRDEEIAFLSGASAVGGAAADLTGARPAAAHRRPATHASTPEPTPARVSTPIPTPVPEPVRPAVAPSALSPEDSAAAGLDIVPVDFLDGQLQASGLAGNGQADALASLDSAIPQIEVASEDPVVPATQLRTPAQPVEPDQDDPVTCLLIDRQTGRTYTGTAPITPIGRERMTGSIVLRDPNVSRRHAELVHDGHAWRLRDLNSTNGTMVNNVDITQCVLHDGDLITVGLMNLEFREG